MVVLIDFSLHFIILLKQWTSSEKVISWNFPRINNSTENLEEKTGCFNSFDLWLFPMQASDRSFQLSWGNFQSREHFLNVPTNSKNIFSPESVRLFRVKITLCTRRLEILISPVSGEESIRQI